MFNVAIIGAGIGAQHMAGFAQLPDQFRVKYICDLDTERGSALAQQYNTTHVTDFDAVLADPEIDLIDICLPPHLHFKACIAALEAGKDVICEKPLVSSLRDADALAQKAEETGKQVFPVFQYRFGPGTAQLHALIDAGLAGKCYTGVVETHWNRPASYYDIDWRGTWQGEQGGAILGHAIHIHDFLPAFLGPVQQVFADLATRVNQIEVEDCAAISMRMRDGTVVTSSVTLGCAEDMSRMRLMFQGFTVESDHAPYAPAAKPWRFLARAPTTQDQIDAVLAQVPEMPIGYPGMFSAVFDAMQGQGGREVTLQDGRNSIEFVTAVYDSARRNAPVQLPLGPDHRMYDSWLP